MSSESQGVSAAWDARAGQWAAWARTPGVDVFFSELNWPAFLGLLPPPGRRTLDVGCGEGRVGRELAALGHRIAGIDSSASLVSLARDATGYDELVCAPAEHLPWPDEGFDLAIAFMSLHDMDDPVAAIAEIARVLEPGGVLCVATVHPLNRPRDSLADYFAEHRVAETVEHEGLEMTFEAIDRPLETYTRALAAAGFVIEELREPRARSPVEAGSRLARALTFPFFVHLRCRLLIASGPSDPANAVASQGEILAAASETKQREERSSRGPVARSATARQAELGGEPRSSRGSFASPRETRSRSSQLVNGAPIRSAPATYAAS